MEGEYEMECLFIISEALVVMEDSSANILYYWWAYGVDMDWDKCVTICRSFGRRIEQPSSIISEVLICNTVIGDG